jgi:hypothetical protein
LVSLLHQWQKEEEERHKKGSKRLCLFWPTGMLVVVIWALVLNKHAERTCDLLFDFYTVLELRLEVVCEYSLSDVCNLMVYSALI